MIRLCRPSEQTAQIQSTKSVSTTTDSQYNLRKARPWRPKSTTDKGGAQRAKAVAWNSGVGRRGPTRVRGCAHALAKEPRTRARMSLFCFRQKKCKPEPKRYLRPLVAQRVVRPGEPRARQKSTNVPLAPADQTSEKRVS